MTEYKIHEIRRRVAQLVKRAQQNPDGSIGPVAQPQYHYGDSVSGMASNLKQVGDWGKNIGIGSGSAWLLNELLHTPKPNPAFGIVGNPDPTTALGRAQTVLNTPGTTRMQRRLANGTIAAGQLQAHRSLTTPTTGGWATPSGISRDVEQVADSLAIPDPTVRGGISMRPELEAAMTGSTYGGHGFAHRARTFMDSPVAGSAPRGGRVRQWWRRIWNHGDARPRNSEVADELTTWAKRQPIRVDTNGRAVVAPVNESWIRRWAREAFSPHTRRGVRDRVSKFTPWLAGAGLLGYGISRAAGGQPQAGTVSDVEDYNPDFESASQFTPPAPATTPVAPQKP